MNHRIFIHLSGFAILILLISQTGSAAASPNLAVSDWKLPLPSGTYIITQGDQDSCNISHCRSSGWGEWVYCSIDLWSSNIDGLPILAPAAGKVLAIADQKGGAGLHMTIQHDDGFVSQYQHLLVVYVQKGDRVVQGQPIARADSSGNSTGAHLHFGVFTNSSYNQCVKIVSMDGNTDFRTGAKVISSNTQVGNIPGEGPSPIPPAPPVTPPPQPPSAPAKPAPSQPGNNSTWPESAEINLAWSSSANASQYKVELWGGPYSTMTPCDWQNNTSCHIGAMRPGTFYWHVKAHNASGQESNWSDTWSFTILGPTDTPTPTPTITPTPLPSAPAAPSLNNPANGASLPQSTDVTLSWNAAANAVEYKVELWGGQYDQIMTPCNWQNGTSCHIGTMWPGTMSWHVKARNAGGQESNWSETWTFAILGPTDTPTPTPTITSTPLPSAPAAPSLSNPPNSASLLQSTDVTLSWNTASNATQYKVELWGGPYTLMTPCDWQSGTSCHIGTMWPGTVSWHVKARNASGQESNWSDTWSFTIYQEATPTFTPSPTATTPPPFAGNIAPQAGRSPDGIGSGNAFDGDLSTFWTDGLGHSFTLTLSLPGQYTINRIIVWDRPQNSPDNNQINALIIRLSNGIEKRFGMDSQGARCIDVTLSSPQMVSSVTLIADDASGNNGLSEVEIWVGAKTGGPTCSNSSSMP